jgi:tetratricopeptide (TPR) repeat protein
MVIGLVLLIVSLNGCSDSNLKKARRYQDAKDYDQAISYYRLALEKDPENRSARYSLVETYAQQLTTGSPQAITTERVESVMGELQPIAEPLMADPSIKRYVSLIYQMLAKRYAEENHHEKVAEIWSKVIAIEPTFAEAHYNLGLALVLTGKYEEALSYFEKAVTLNPYFFRGYQGMGDSLLQLDRAEEAIKQYLKALDLNPDDPAVHCNLGIAYSVVENNEKAVEEFEKTLELDSYYMLAYPRLYEMYVKMEETQKAEEVQKKWNEFSEALVQARQEQEGRPPSAGDSE